MDDNVTAIGTSSSAVFYALKYASLGWHVLPVWGGENGKCRCGKQCTSPGKHPINWLVKQGQDNATTDPDIIKGWYAAAPWAGVAISLTPSGLVAVDIDPRNGGYETMEIIEGIHGDLISDVFEYTQGGGEHRIFQLAKENQMSLPGKLGEGVDLKRNGYIVAAPTQGVMGVYEWDASSDPMDGAIPSPLPDWIRDLAQARTTTAAAATAAGGERYVTPEQLLDIKEALSYIPADDYHSWVNIGQALRSIGAQGFGLWDTWSQTSEKYDPSEMGRKWRSFKSGAFNIESIFQMAASGGWVNPRSAVATKREQELQALADRAQSTAKIEIEAPTEQLLDFPVPLLNELDGWIAAENGMQPSVATQMSALAVASTVSARLYSQPTHLHLMLSAQTIGSTMGLQRSISRILQAAGLRKMLREQRFNAASSLLKTLIRSPASLYLAADWGSWSAFAKRQPAGIAEYIMHMIAASYTQDSILVDNPDELGFRGSSVSSDDMPIIQLPALSVFAATSRAMLPQVYSAADIGRGTAQNFIYHQMPDSLPVLPGVSDVPAWVVEHLRKIRRLPIEQNDTQLDLVSIFNGNAEIIPSLTPIQWEAAPSDYWAQLHDSAHITATAMPIIQGARIHMARVAAVLAVWANPEHPMVSHKILQWSATWCGQRLTETLMALRLIGGSEDGKTNIYQAILSSITDAGADGITPTGLRAACYKYRALSKQKRDEAIGLLLEDGAVVELSGNRGNGTRLISAQFVKGCSKND